MNNYVARVASLLAVAVLPALVGISGSSYLHPAELSAAFRKAMIISAVTCALGGVIAAIGIRNPTRAALRPGSLVRPVSRARSMRRRSERRLERRRECS